MISALLHNAPRIVVTGAGGWLGQAALDLLDGVYGEALSERVAAFGASERPMRLRSGRTITCRPLEALPALGWTRPWFLNFAFLGRERLSDLPLNEYVAQNDRITDLVTDAVERTGASGMFLPSSGAVYRRPGRRLQEDLSADPYGALKLRDERRFQGLGLRLGFPVSIFRVFNLAGPFINKLNSYALATILSDLNRGGPVVLRAAHPVIRAYTHVGDVLTLALADLATGRSGPPIDTLGAPAIEIGDLARLASTALGLPEPEIIRPPFDGTPPDNYVGDGEAFAALAERHGIMLTDLPNQIRATAAYLRDLA